MGWPCFPSRSWCRIEDVPRLCAQFYLLAPAGQAPPVRDWITCLEGLELPLVPVRFDRDSGTIGWFGTCPIPRTCSGELGRAGGGLEVHLQVTAPSSVRDWKLRWICNAHQGVIDLGWSDPRVGAPARACQAISCGPPFAATWTLDLAVVHVTERTCLCPGEAGPGLPWFPLPWFEEPPWPFTWF